MYLFGSGLFYLETRKTILQLFAACHTEDQPAKELGKYLES